MKSTHFLQFYIQSYSQKLTFKFIILNSRRQTEKSKHATSMLYKNKSTINAKVPHGILKEIEFFDQRKIQGMKPVSKDENMQVIKPQKQSQPVERVEQKEKKTVAPMEKRIQIPVQPGKPVPAFQQIISTTETVQNGVATYLISKALSGPMLQFASQMKEQYRKQPIKPIPDITSAINGSLEPHLLGYSTLTHQGIYRQTNQDKICIYLEDDYKWFSIYDGHGGNKCSQFLKDNLHQSFLKSNWRKDIPNALRNAFYSAQQEWKKVGDKSGSCALVVFIHQNTCYVANLGDSRAILTSENNKKLYQITKDHKPSNPSQQERVIKAGGKIYQTTAFTRRQKSPEDQPQFDMILGPLRVFPGRLSITRTIGDTDAKDPQKNGGNFNEVVTCEPQITSFNIDKHDMIVMASDGLWDRLENTQVSQKIQSMLEQKEQMNSAQMEYDPEILSRICQFLVQEAMKRNSTDNISVITIHLNEKTEQEKKVLQSNVNNENITIHMSKSKLSNKVKHMGTSNQQRIHELSQKIKAINQNVSKISR